MKTWYNGNFPTHQAETAHMKALREQGYNNREIAKMVGRAIHTVYDNIGPQPKIMTQLSNQLAGEHRAKANQNHKIAVATAKRLEYERRLEAQKLAEETRDKVQKEMAEAIKKWKAACEELGKARVNVWEYSHEYENAMNVLRSA